MRAFVGALFLTLAVPGVTQFPSQESITIGDLGEARLFLGQPKDSVLRALRESFDVKDSTAGQFGISAKNNPELFYGWVSFKEGKLSSIKKTWKVNGPDRGVAVVRAIRGAMSSFGRFRQQCTVENFDNQEPTVEKSGVVVSCGKREVEVFTNRWTFSTGSGESVVINEVLSSEP